MSKMVLVTGSTGSTGSKTVKFLLNAGARVRAFVHSEDDRHRGSGCPLTPATPPCVRVRTRRFEMVYANAHPPNSGDRAI